MPVDVKKVAGRRVLEFASFEEILVDARMLVASDTTRTLGNWPLGKLLTHLANAMNMSIDGIAHQAPWFIRMAGPMIKRRILTRGMAAGFKLPRAAEAGSFPEVGSKEAGLATLERAIERTKVERMTSRHPVFGKMTHEEWMTLHLRHAELHLSFARTD